MRVICKYKCWKCLRTVEKKGRCQSCKNIRAEHLWFIADRLLGVNK
jgi:hypothetical protein